jgi:hypothetical protein
VEIGAFREVDRDLRSPGSSSDESEVETEKLYSQIGKLKVEVDFLKKVSAKLGIKK